MREESIVSQFLPYFAGSPYQPLLASALAGHGVDVIRSPAQRSASKQRHADLIHVHWLPIAGPHPRRALRAVRFVRRLANRKRRGLPIIWTAHNLVPHETRLVWLDLCLSSIIAQLSDRIICHSESARAELIARLRVRQTSKVRVIPHGNFIGYYPNDLSLQKCRGKFSLPLDATVFLALGHVRAYKGTLSLLDAFHRLPEPGARLLIAGRPYTPDLDAQIRSRALSDPRVVYVPGYVEDADLQLYLNAADAVIFPHKRSLTSGGLILAMSYARACIASRHPTMVECVTDRGGIFYDPDQPDGLLGALSTAAAQPERLREMGESNFERAKMWDWPSIASATAECYREAIGRCQLVSA